MAQAWRLSPSDFGFLWNECKRCFYLKVARGYYRPFGVFPKIFQVIDRLMKEQFEGREISELVPELPRGKVQSGKKQVESAPIEVPGHPGKCYIYGNFDTVVKFESGGYGVIDFKTTEIKADKAALYSAQLHAYAHALENPAPGAMGLKPVTTLGLLCVEPSVSERSPEGIYSFRGKSAWIGIPRDDAGFRKLLGEVLDILGKPEPPPAGGGCDWCAYREKARTVKF
jgi:hypothetical protein